MPTDTEYSDPSGDSPSGILLLIPRFFRWLWRSPVLRVVAAIVLLFVVILGIKAFQFRKMMAMGASMTPPPESVSSTEVVQKEWPAILKAVGSITSVQGAMLSAEVPGVVAEVKFENGATVKKGDLLVRLDASNEEAQLRSAEADAQLAKADLERSRDLAARNVIARAELDAAETRYKQRIAAVDNIRASIEKKEIRAPFDGKAGIRQVNIGQTVPEGFQVVALQSVDPVYVDFSIPQQKVAELSEGLEVIVRTDSFPDREFKGKLTAVNSMIDKDTRSVPLQATLENREHLLKPGMFAKVELVLSRQNPTVVIPATAVSYSPSGDSVYVIEKTNDPKTKKEALTVRQQFVRITESRGDMVSVAKGLKAAQQVVSKGVFKLRNGMAVQIKEDVGPKPEESPTPPNT